MTLFLGLLLIWLIVSTWPIAPPGKYIIGAVIVAIVVVVLVIGWALGGLEWPRVR